MGCKVARKVGWKVLRLPEKGNYEDRKKSLVGAAKEDKEEKTCWHLMAYAILKTTNRRRNNKTKGGEEEELKQELRNAVEGHKKSAQVVQRRWARPAAGGSRAGTVKRWLDDKGFGGISMESGEDCYVHRLVPSDGQTLNQGQSVSMVVEWEGQRSKWRATSFTGAGGKGDGGGMMGGMAAADGGGRFSPY